MKTITIIGGGLSGTLLAINLLKQASRQPVYVILIEKNNGKNALGAAYSTNKPFHLLNVRAKDMGALAGDKLHFVKWLKENKISITPAAFAPRMIYRKYVLELLKQTIAENKTKSNFRKITDEVINVIPADDGKIVKLQLKGGEAFECNKVILAIGNLPPHNPPASDMNYVQSKSYFPDPWSMDVSSGINSKGKIFIIGTSLTMVDVVLSLYYRKHKGEIIALSRHGDLPFVHKIHRIYPSFYKEVKHKDSALEIFKIIRKHIAKAEENGIGWRAVIDSLRPFSQKLWQKISLKEKQQFLHHFKHIWEISRHRIPKNCNDILTQMQKSGQLKITAGNIQDIKDAGKQINITFRERKTKEIKTEQADLIVNCTGPVTNYNKVNEPLIRNLLKNGILSSDDLNLGIKTLPNGALITKSGKPSDIFYSLGTPMKGILWECTAVPEIRQQANDLAKILLKN